MHKINKNLHKGAKEDEAGKTMTIGMEEEKKEDQESTVSKEEEDDKSSTSASIRMKFCDKYVCIAVIISFC